MRLVQRVMLLGALLFCGSAAWAGEGVTADTADRTIEPGRSLERDKICTKCHDENDDKPILTIYQTRHGVRGDARTPSCQSCHGESTAHVKNEAGSKDRPKPDVLFSGKNKSESEAQAGKCIACHESGKRMNWTGSQHQSREVACSSCHTAHAPRDRVLTKSSQPEVCFTCHKTQRAETHLISTHPLAAGKMGCTDCHNAHGSTGPKLLVKNSVNETCYTCHAEKRGPFLWEHAPVVDDCSTCHTPHGSAKTPLLKARVPYLCQECHSGDHGNQVNSAANFANGNVTTVNGINPPANAAARAQLMARACLNCHVLVHGSNHPAGAKFQR